MADMKFFYDDLIIINLYIQELIAYELKALINFYPFFIHRIQSKIHIQTEVLHLRLNKKED